MATALAYAQPEPSYDAVAIGASAAFHASLAAAERGDWTADPEAQSILASIRANPPKCVAVAMDHLHREFAGKPAIRFTGRRVARLEAICGRVFAECEREAFPQVGTGDRRALDVWLKVGLPVDVIEAELGL